MESAVPDTITIAGITSPAGYEGGVVLTRGADVSGFHVLQYSDSNHNWAVTIPFPGETGNSTIQAHEIGSFDPSYYAYEISEGDTPIEEKTWNLTAGTGGPILSVSDAPIEGAVTAAPGTIYNQVVDGVLLARWVCVSEEVWELVNAGTVSDEELLEMAEDNAAAMRGALSMGSDDAVSFASLALTGKLSINSQQTVYNADSVFTGSLFVGNGGASLSNTTGNQGYRNTAIGIDALLSCTTGENDTAAGCYALRSVTTGGNNTGVGAYALYANTSGALNTSIGSHALRTNVAGGRNAAAGYFALYANNSGSYNTATGHYSLGANVSGNNNTASGNYSLGGNTTGRDNVALGFDAGRFLANGSTARATGDYGTYLGSSTKSSAAGTTNEIVIGYNAIGNGSNTATYGSSAITAHVFTAGTVSFPGATTISGMLAANGGLRSVPEVLTTEGDVGLATLTTVLDFADDTQALALAAGSSGQIKIIVVKDVDAIQPPVLTSGDSQGWTSITFDTAGGNVILMYVTGFGWTIISAKNVTVA